MSELQNVTIADMDPHRFASVLSEDEFRELLGLIEVGTELMRGRIVWNVNSTPTGGGVAELLRPLLGYCRGSGVDARWRVISGNREFFAITKRLHNRLHGSDGDGGELGPAERASYERTLAGNGQELAGLVHRDDIVVLHDPQTAGIAESVRATGAAVIWRCHVGLDHANDRAVEAWDFLRPYVLPADAYVFSREAFAWDGLDHDKITVIQPSIDVFSPKNAGQAPVQTRAILAQAGIVTHPGAGEATFTRSDGVPSRVRLRAEMIEEQALTPDDRLVTQISRWDALKDPVGVIRGFTEHVADQLEAHLVLAGPSASAVADDPEGAAVFASVRDAWHALPDDRRRRVHLASLPMEDIDQNAAIVNALQRHSEIVVQKSLAEGFGLTVAEAMWKERPVVASRIGGIQDQIVDGESGVLLSDPRDPREFGAAVSDLLADRERASRIGLAARDRVQHHFLGPHHLGRYFELISRLIGARTEA
jgi:trehalose synthase